jgi:hypothetical protein
MSKAEDGLNVSPYYSYVLIFSTNLSATFLTLRRIHRNIIINVHLSLCKVPVIIIRL